MVFFMGVPIHYERNFDLDTFDVDVPSNTQIRKGIDRAKKSPLFPIVFFNLVKKLRLSQGALPHWAEVSCHIVFPTPPLHCPSHPHLLSICNH